MLGKYLCSLQCETPKLYDLRWNALHILEKLNLSLQLVPPPPLHSKLLGLQSVELRIILLLKVWHPYRFLSTDWGISTIPVALKRKSSIRLELNITRDMKLLLGLPLHPPFSILCYSNCQDKCMMTAASAPLLDHSNRVPLWLKEPAVTYKIVANAFFKKWNCGIQVF